MLEQIEVQAFSTKAMTRSNKYETGEYQLLGKVVGYYWKKTGSDVLHLCGSLELLAEVILTRDL